MEQLPEDLRNVNNISEVVCAPPINIPVNQEEKQIFNDFPPQEPSTQTSESIDITSETHVKPEENELSKKQLKRLRKREQWLAKLPAKRAKEKEKLRERREEAREQNIQLGPSRKALKNSKMETSSCKIRIALDFSFDHLMSTKDISKCVNQALRCYSVNRRAENPVQFYIVNFNSKSRDEMAKHNGYENWDVHIHSEDYLNLFKKEECFYLTSDSDNVVEKLENDKVYIIGAFVDHNAHKGLCHKTAVEQKIGHGQLPIGQHMDMKTRKVLAVNHVFEIMLLVCNGVSWEDAFMKVLPLRKGAKEKQRVKEDGEEDSD